MKIELKSIKIADLINGYSNDTDTGVKGFEVNWISVHLSA